MPGLRLVGLAAGRAAAAVCEQALAHDVPEVCLHDAGAAAEAAARAPRLRVHAGETGIRELIAGAAGRAAGEGVPLTVLNGVVGAAGLRATMATLEAGATLALANKESMVAGGPFVLDAARRSGSLILPVDSEHSALFQCIAAGGGPAAGNGEEAGPPHALEELLLTGSGGPFRGRTAAELAAVTPEEALAHPNWSMGPKITIDSATLMNKGLELIEAHYLFGVPVRAHHRRARPPQHGAQHGALLRRRHPRASRRARHAHAHRVRARLSAATCAAAGAPARPLRHADRLLAAGHGDVPLPGARRGGREEGSRGASARRPPPARRRAPWPPRSCSTPPTRSPSRRSSAGGSPSSASPRSSRSASPGSRDEPVRIARRRVRVRRGGATLRA